MAAAGELSGLRVLVVEDEALIAMMIEELLDDFGCAVVGPVARVEAAQRAARDDAFDCAILDVNLNGEAVHPVAEILAARGIPFAFVTGYGDAAKGGRFGTRPVLRKPFKHDELRTVLTQLLQHE